MWLTFYLIVDRGLYFKREFSWTGITLTSNANNHKLTLSTICLRLTTKYETYSPELMWLTYQYVTNWLNIVIFNNRNQNSQDIHSWTNNHYTAESSMPDTQRTRRKNRHINNSRIAQCQRDTNKCWEYTKWPTRTEESRKSLPRMKTWSEY